MTALAVAPAPATTEPHSRTDKVAAGLLIDVTAEARRLGWRWPVHLTREAWEMTVRWDAEIEARKAFSCPEEPEGRLRNLLWLGLVAVRPATGNRVWFDADCVPPYGAAVNCRAIPMVATIGPSDDLKPVVTIDVA